MGFREDEMENSDQEKVRLLYRLYGKRGGLKGQMSNIRPHVSPWKNGNLQNMLLLTILLTI